MFNFHIKKSSSFFHDIYKIGNFRFKINTFRPKKYRDLAEYTYKKAYFSWIRHGASDALMQELAYLETSDAAWLTELKALWLIYSSCLLQRSNKTEALRVLQKYHYCFGTVNIPYFLPVAHLAYENGISNKQIELANNLFLRFEREQKENSFEEKILNAKSVAIVGNAPNVLGQNKGKEIDDHDIVIRINNFQLKQYKADVGTKTDIWFKDMGTLYGNNTVSYDTDILNVISYNYWNTAFQIHLFNPDSIANRPLYFTPTNVYETITPIIAPAIPFPTTGYIAILWTYSLLKSFRNVDIYGFSFLDENVTTYNYYYDKKFKYLHTSQKEDLITMHNMQQECINLKKLYTK